MSTERGVAVERGGAPRAGLSAADAARRRPRARPLGGPPAGRSDTGQVGAGSSSLVILLARPARSSCSPRPSSLVLAALFAVLIAGTFLPVVDWLARHHVKRWIAAFLVVIFLILLAVGICLVVLYGLVNEALLEAGDIYPNIVVLDADLQELLPDGGVLPTVSRQGF